MTPAIHPDDQMYLSCTDTVLGQPSTARVPISRSLWEGWAEDDREACRAIVRLRFAKWIREETGVRLSDGHVATLPVHTE